MSMHRAPATTATASLWYGKSLDAEGSVMDKEREKGVFVMEEEREGGAAQ